MTESLAEIMETVNHLSSDVFSGALFVLIGAFMVRDGVPPFYVPFKLKEQFRFGSKGTSSVARTEIKWVLIAFLLTMPFFFVAVIFQVYPILLPFAFAVFWYVSQIRRQIMAETGGVMNWMSYSIFKRSPMLAFDIWLIFLFVAFTQFGPSAQ